MLLVDERCLQPDLVGADRIVPVASVARKMSLANPLWGAPRIHGELLKLGIDVGQTTVASASRTQEQRHFGRFNDARQ
jgi:hypothetical protein